MSKMTCSFARFVVFYKNGESVIEDKRISDFWDLLPDKKEIIAMGIKYDPLVLDEKDKFGRQLRLCDIPQHLILKSSERHNYRFFQFKTVDMQVGRSRGQNAGRYEVNLTIGMVVDREGHCIVLEAMPDTIINIYYTTVFNLGLNLDLFEINLGEIT